MKQNLLRCISISIMLLLTLPVVAQEAFQVDHDGRTRGYVLAIPEDYSEDTNQPLLIVLHGAGGDAVQMMITTRFAEFANEQGWLVAFPTGIQQGWDYLEQKDLHPDEEHVDDTGFINTLIDDVSSNYAVDESRIYVVGYSNGALLGLRLSCELADKLDGIVAIAGTYSFEIIQYCLGAAPVPVMIVWGTEDATFPTEGYVVERDANRVRTSFSLTQTRTYISTHFGCEDPPQATRVDNESSPYPIVIETYTCADNTVSKILVMVNHPHSFPVTPIVNLDNGEVGDVQDAIFEFLLANSED